jgi:sugar/nucleoside kinase (ribokinase family)
MEGSPVVVAVGSCCVDLMGVVDRFPKPDDKTRTRHFQVHSPTLTGLDFVCVRVCVCVLRVHACADAEDDASCVVRRASQVEGGGNCGNVAVALSRLGVAVRPLAKLGADAWGNLIAQQLRDEGVDTWSLVIKPG